MSQPTTIQTLCPVCEESEFRFRFEKKGRQFWRCQTCGLEKQHPLPTYAELAKYYDQSYSDGMYQSFAAATQMKQLTAAQRLKEIRKFVRLKGEWLDVGCANGVFVRAAAEAGMNAEGVELSENAAAEGREQGVPITAGTISDLQHDRKYDCITAFDVLEHVIDPVELIQQILSRLKPGGHMVLTLPNRRSLPALLMGARWYFYIPEEHLHYFDPVTLPRLAERLGLATVKVKRTYKPLTFNYLLIQFSEYNPWIYRFLSALGLLIPRRLKEVCVPLYIGEMMMIAQKPNDG